MQQEEPRDEVDESEDTDSSSASEMFELLMSAKDLLNSSRFEDAETTFLKLYNELQVNVYRYIKLTNMTSEIKSILILGLNRVRKLF